MDVGGSPIGYRGHVPSPEGSAATCPPTPFDLRWDLDGLQPLFGPPSLDEVRTTTLVREATRRDAIGKVFVEPHLAARLDVSSPRIRFQGCRAAHHDDHVHLELR
jgi:hypothetical protein